MKWQTVEPALRETLLARGDVDGITGFYFTSLLNLESRGVKTEDIVALKLSGLRRRTLRQRDHR